MSGFVAIVNLDGAPVDRGLLGRMAALLAFRGPDGQRVHVAGNAGLGHALLRMPVESDRDEQPFTLEGRRWIVADARVDAREDLIAALGARDADACARDVPDVELLFRAYRAWGEECVAHLLGDFTFVVWDEPRQRLFCARDQLGVKPCFYAQLGQTIVVSNTLDCVRLHPGVSTNLHDPAIADFLLFGANQETDTTVFRDIQRLPAGHSITWSRETAQRRRYWTLPVEGPLYFRRAADYTDRLTELLDAATRDRVRSRDAGVMLSGGLDSSALAAAATRALREGSSDAAPQAFTCVYDRLIPLADRHYAGLVAAHLNIPIRYDARDDEPSIADWGQASAYTPEPVANPPAFLAGVAFLRNVVAPTRVLLYGEGPDDALRYEWSPYVSHLLKCRRVALLVRAIADDLVMHPRVVFWSSIRMIAGARAQARRWEPRFPDWLDDGFAARCNCKDRWAAKSETSVSPHALRPRAYESFRAVHWQPLFDDCDLGGAFGHAEFRHPFLDLRVLRYLLAVPAVPWCRNKLIIRRAMRSALPAAVVGRKKTNVRVSADFARARGGGFPRLVPSSELRRYVIPGRVPSAPESELELRAALRPLGLNHWLQQRANTDRREVHHEAAHTVRSGK